MSRNKRSIEAIIAPPPPHMVGDGFRVHNFFPNSHLIDKKRMSPFFMLDYGEKSNSILPGSQEVWVCILMQVLKQ